MAVNLLTATEDFTDVAWVNTSVTITADSTSPPSLYGPNAGGADTLADNDVLVGSNLFQAVVKDPGDVDTYLFSLFVAKQVTQVFMSIALSFAGVATTSVAFNFDPSTGDTGISPDFTSPPGYGVEDVNSAYWRIWCRYADPNSNTLIRTILWPARIDQSAITNSGDSAATGSVIAWGANLTKGASLLPYEPEPIYSFQTRFLLARP